MGEAYGFGVRAGYEKLTASNNVSVGKYAAKSNDKELFRRLTMAETVCSAAISDAISTLDDKLPGFVRSITSPLKSIVDCAKKHPALGPLARQRSTDGPKEKKFHFQSFFFNVNASTKTFHSEKDCSYTLIYSPDSANTADQDTRFEFALTKHLTLDILMRGGVVFCYSAYVLTHR
jgi:hypothetical protein